MSPTAKWLEVLDRAGKFCTMAKVDWAAAYKHIAVRPEDVPLQYFNWLGSSPKNWEVYNCALDYGS
jgi:hypothetical protein